MPTTSTSARQLRSLIYDWLMTGLATDADRSQADSIAADLGLAAPTQATTLLALDRIGRAAFGLLADVDVSKDATSAAAALGRLGGRAKSAAKAASSAANGKKGGRPKKQDADHGAT